MKSINTMQNIIRKYPLIGNGALMLLVAGSALFNLSAYRELQPPPLNAPLTITFALLVIIPLVWRRLFLIISLIFIMVAFIVLDILNIPSMNCSSIAAIISVFCAAAYGGNKRNFACTASIVVYNGGLTYKVMFSSNAAFLSTTTVFNITGLLWSLTTFLAIWWFSNRLRLNRERTSILSESIAKLAGERKENVCRTVLNDCVRIARELHDVLVHHIIIIGAKTGVACQVLKQYPGKMLKASSLIETSSRQVVSELCYLLGFLQDEERVEDVQAFGLQAEVKIEEEKCEIPQTVALLSEERIPCQVPE